MTGLRLIPYVYSIVCEHSNMLSINEGIVKLYPVTSLQWYQHNHATTHVLRVQCISEQLIFTSNTPADLLQSVLFADRFSSPMSLLRYPLDSSINHCHPFLHRQRCGYVGEHMSNSVCVCVCTCTSCGRFYNHSQILAEIMKMPAHQICKCIYMLIKDIENYNTID